MMRRTALRWCLGARSSAVVVPESKVTAWYTGSRINLDGLEYRLRLAHWPHARVASSSASTTGTTATNTTPPGVTGADKGGGASGTTAHGVHSAARAMDAIVFSVANDPKLVVADATLATLARQAHARKTFVVMAEGAIVGWNGQWSDLVSVWGLSGSGSTGGAAPAPGTPHDNSAAARDGASTMATPSNSVTESVKFALADANLRESLDPSDAVTLNTIDPDSDTFLIADHNDVHKLPLSYAMAQSVKIDVVDLALAPVQAKLKDWQKHLALTGGLKCTVRDLRQTKTQLLTLFEDLNFTHSAQTTPRIFWTAKYQRHRAVYKSAREYLEIDDRYEQLQGKIEAIDESLSFLQSEVHTSTNELLTWVIIWLIAVEILLALDVHHWLIRLVWPAGKADAASVTEPPAASSEATGATSGESSATAKGAAA